MGKMPERVWSKVPISIKGFAILQIGEDGRIVQSLQMREKDIDFILSNIRADEVESEELQKVRDTLCLLRSMVDCGEKHSIHSLSMLEEALGIIENHRLIKRKINDNL